MANVAHSWSRRSYRLPQRVDRARRIERDFELVSLEIGTRAPEASLEARDEIPRALVRFSSDRRSGVESATARAIARDGSDQFGVFEREHHAAMAPGREA